MIRMSIVVLRFRASFKNISFKGFCTELDPFISNGLTTGVFMIICPIFLFQGTFWGRGRGVKKAIAYSDRFLGMQNLFILNSSLSRNQPQTHLSEHFNRYPS